MHTFKNFNMEVLLLWWNIIFSIFISKDFVFMVVCLCLLVEIIKVFLLWIIGYYFNIWAPHLSIAWFDQLFRAKYIVGTVKALQEKPGGGVNWLASLRGLELPQVIDALCTLPGVGPKVAACIALFSLDQHHAIPVDTHVWQVSSWTNGTLINVLDLNSDSYS